MSESFDVIVVGLGAMGCAAVFHLARCGRRVLGLDQHRPPHTLGSSHGKTRIIREAYFEHPVYVPLVQRAYDLWAELEKESGETLFRQTGGLMIGPEGGVIFEGARRSAELHRLAHEILSADEVQRQFPAFHPAPHMRAVWEPRAGILFPERCVAAHLEIARRRGATIRVEETVRRWHADGPGVSVETDRGRYHADQLLLTAGPWIGSLLPEMKPYFTVERQVQYWFDPVARREAFAPERCPVHIWEHEAGGYFYGFPELGEGVKLAGHHNGEISDPDRVDRDVREPEIAAIRSVLQRFLPDVNGPLRSTAVCLYTNTADGHFFIDRPPGYPGVLVASPCSGHGFKFSSAIGELLAEWIVGRPTRFDLSLFRWRTG